MFAAYVGEHEAVRVNLRPTTLNNAEERARRVQGPVHPGRDPSCSLTVKVVSPGPRGLFPGCMLCIGLRKMAKEPH